MITLDDKIERGDIIVSPAERVKVIRSNVQDVDSQYRTTYKEFNLVIHPASEKPTKKNTETWVQLAWNKDVIAHFTQRFCPEMCSIEKCADVKRDKPWLPLKKCTKGDIIAYCIKVLGPHEAEDLLRFTAYIEDKPYLPASNGDYFSTISGSLRDKKIITQDPDNKKRKAQWVLAVNGHAPAEKAFAKLGGELAAREAQLYS